jgi:hypothetical protein
MPLHAFRRATVAAVAATRMPSRSLASLLAMFYSARSAAIGSARDARHAGAQLAAKAAADSISAAAANEIASVGERPNKRAPTND